MSEPSPVAVRDLQALAVYIDDKSFQLPLRKRESVSLAHFFDDRQEEFTRRVHKITTRRFHSVAGAAALGDDKAQDVFEAIYIIPYENREIWAGAVRDKTGVIRMEPSRSGEQTATTSKGSKGRGEKNVRTITKAS